MALLDRPQTNSAISVRTEVLIWFKVQTDAAMCSRGGDTQANKFNVVRTCESEYLAGCLTD